MRLSFRRAVLYVFILTSTVSSAWCAVEIKGAGGVSEKPLAQAWVNEYSQARLKYDCKNTAEAVNEFLSKDCDYALIDSSFTALESPKASSHHLLYFPTALSAQAVIYNLPGIPSGALKLTPAVLSDIFMGKIKKWNDPALHQLNPRLLLPDIAIRVLHRSDESSMNDFFPSFLENQNSRWILKREKDKNLHWPVGQSVNGNKKVLDKTRQWAGVIAVINYSFAEEKKLPVAKIQNKAGKFMAPTNESMDASISETALLSGSKPAALTESLNKKAYPLATVDWAVVDQDYFKIHHNHDKGQALVNFLNWVLSVNGQATASKTGHISLPQVILSQARTKIQLIEY
ncbi:MAG TPA: phosphate ABC transporter substrate-binding protein PstS [bacterium]|nr:phosphate ABC transporter substrate-binding protein PstS [bacterium]